MCQHFKDMIFCSKNTYQPSKYLFSRPLYLNLYNCMVLDFMIKSRMLSAVSNCCQLAFMTFFSKSILGFDFSINAIYNVFPLCPKHHLVASERNVARIPYIETTLRFLINVRRTFINFQHISYPYDFIWDRTFISFWN